MNSIKYAKRFPSKLDWHDARLDSQFIKKLKSNLKDPLKSRIENKKEGRMNDITSYAAADSQNEDN